MLIAPAENACNNGNQGQIDMTIHPSVLQKSKCIGRYLPIPGILAAMIFLLTLSHGVYPGHSSTLTAAAAGLIPPSGEDHPLFAWVVRNLATIDVFSLPVRLNLFSALCGTLGAMLIYLLVARIVLFSACEGADAEDWNDPPDEARDESDVVSEMPRDADLHNRRVLRIAIVGGLIAAFLFLFAAPIWSAATRLENGLFDLLLALAALSLFPMGSALIRLPVLALSVFLFTLGLFEAAVFLLLLPCYAFFTLKTFVLSRRRMAMVGWIVAAGTAGIACSIFAYWQNLDDPSAASLLKVLFSYARALPPHHYRELLSFLPHSGWALVLVQTALPVIVLLFGKQALFKEQRSGTATVTLLILLSAVPEFLNLPVSPFTVFLPMGHLPVFGTTILAFTTAIAIASCLLVFGPEDRPRDDDLSKEEEFELHRGTRSLRVVTGALLLMLVLLVPTVPWRSFRDVNASQGAFADAAARDVLTIMQGRTWLISSGYLDNHLLIQASMRNQPLNLITLRPQALPQEVKTTQRLIATSPVFAGHNRQRLQNALYIGTIRFVREWFSADPKAGAYAMVLATPDIWTACGYRAVPEGLAFGGVHPGQELDLAGPIKNNRSLAEGIVPLLLDPNETEGHIARLSEIIRMRAGFAANELGVLLEETNEIEAAWQVYSQARKIDPMNISAAINGYALASAYSIHPESLEGLKADIQSLIALRSRRVHGLTGILQNYGTIRHQAFYQQQAAMWSARGAGTVANEKQRKALALSEQTGAAALVENALFYGHADDYAKAETCYLAALEKDASHPGALTGIVTLMLIRHKPAEAEKWVQRALAAGVGEEALLHQNITLLILKKDLERARALLREATKKYPADLRYWTLLADLTLNEGDMQTVEHSILPKMEKALSTPNHFLVHMVRGLLLRKKGPGSYKQARLSLINALVCNAAMPEIWNILLELDMALGDPASTEADARRLLAADPDHALANYLMGSILLARGAWQESEDFLRRSIEKHPTATACNDLAENLRRQKKLSEAERLVRQALTSDPAHVHAFDTLACILFDAGQYVDAVQAAAKAVTAQPDNPAYQLTLLRAQIRLGNKDGVRQRQQALARLRAEIPEPLQQEIRDMK